MEIVWLEVLVNPGTQQKKLISSKIKFMVLPDSMLEDILIKPKDIAHILLQKV